MVITAQGQELQVQHDDNFIIICSIDNPNLQILAISKENDILSVSNNLRATSPESEINFNYHKTSSDLNDWIDLFLGLWSTINELIDLDSIENSVKSINDNISRLTEGYFRRR